MFFQERPHVVDNIPPSAYHLSDTTLNQDYDPLGNPIAPGLGLAAGQGLGGMQQSPLATTFQNLVHLKSSMLSLGGTEVKVLDIPLVPVDLLNPSQPVDHIPILPPPSTPQLPASDAELLASGWPWRGGITFNGQSVNQSISPSINLSVRPSDTSI